MRNDRSGATASFPHAAVHDSNVTSGRSRCSTVTFSADDRFLRQVAGVVPVVHVAAEGYVVEPCVAVRQSLELLDSAGERWQRWGQP
jgi:hypothetical protein